MAVTVSQRKGFSSGNLRQVNLELETTTASGVVDTGLKNINHILYAPKSMATVSVTLKPNLGSGATAIGGRLNYNSAAAGDTFFITVYGN